MLVSLLGKEYATVGPRPEYPQTTVEKGASAFELDFVYLIDCLSVCKQILVTLLARDPSYPQTTVDKRWPQFLN